MKIYLYPASGENRYGDALYRAMSEFGEVLYEHISSSPGWGMHDLRGGLNRSGKLDGNELIESGPPEAVRLAAETWAALHEETPDAAVNAAREGEASVGQVMRSTPEGIEAGPPDANTAAAASGPNEPETYWHGAGAEEDDRG